MPKVKIPITIDEADLAEIKRLTGKKKDASALLVALIEYLDSHKVEAVSKEISPGGYRVENTPAYKAGFEWGKQAAQEKWDIDMWSDGAAVDSQDAFEEWIPESRLKNYNKLFSEWCKGTLEGWLEAGGTFPHDTRNFPSIGNSNAK
jgi:hypothetical protein